VKAYPDDLLKTSLIVEEAEAYKVGHPEISTAYNLVKAKIYQPPFWIRIGLFIAAWLGGAFVMGWVWLAVYAFFENFIPDEFNFLLISVLLAAMAFLAGRHFIEVKHHYCSGVDDAAAIACLFSIAATAFQLREIMHLPPLSCYSLIAGAGITICFSAYYLDRFMAILAMGLLLFGLYKLVLITPLGMLIIPVVYFGVGLILWFVNRRWQQKQNLFYEPLLNFVEVCSLVLIAVSLQFSLVSFSFQALMNVQGLLPFGWIFQILSFVIPCVMTIIGWQIKNRAMLWVGFLASVFAIYAQGSIVWMWPHELCLLLIGFLFLSIGYTLYILFKDSKLAGFDMESRAKSHFLQDVVSQVVQATVTTERPEAKETPKFGGGDFGGAGASSGY